MTIVLNDRAKQANITLDNVSEYRDALEKKLDQRRTPECIKSALLYTVDYLSGDLDGYYYGRVLYFLEKDCIKLNSMSCKGEEFKLRTEELNTEDEIYKLSRKSPYAKDYKSFITVADKRKCLFEALLPYFK